MAGIKLQEINIWKHTYTVWSSGRRQK